MKDKGANVGTRERVPDRPRRNFGAVPARPFALLLLATTALCSTAQTLPGDTAAAHSHSASFTLPMNSVQVYDRAMEAWKYSFGQEPGARITKADRSAGTIEGQARVNYRSEVLIGREETMGIIAYRVIIHSEAGKCRVLVTDMDHTGNVHTYRGGIHFGRITRSISPSQRVRGMSGRNAERVLEDMKKQSDGRILEVLKRFGNHIRTVDP
jgi:hypothetical protein